MVDPEALEAARGENYKKRKKSKPAADESADSDFVLSDTDGHGAGFAEDMSDDGVGSGSAYRHKNSKNSGASEKRPSKERASKAARAHAKSYAANSIVAPQYVISSVLAELQRHQVRKKPSVVQKVARYWSLKRASRRGAPLLKRLHLEVRDTGWSRPRVTGCNPLCVFPYQPWTASSHSKEDEEARARKLEVLLAIRRDLEKVRMLVELVHKREKAKLRAMHAQRDFLEFVCEPVSHVLKPTLEELIK